MKKKINSSQPKILDDNTDPEIEFDNLDYIKKLEIQNLILNKIISSKANKGIIKDIHSKNQD